MTDETLTSFLKQIIVILTRIEQKMDKTQSKEK